MGDCQVRLIMKASALFTGAFAMIITQAHRAALSEISCALGRLSCPSAKVLTSVIHFHKRP